MSKKIAKSLLGIITGIGLLAGNALADTYNFNISGNATFLNSNSTSWDDTITFENLTISKVFHRDDTGTRTTISDPIKGYSVNIANLLFTDGTYNFSQTLYTDGFKMYNTFGKLIAEADLTVSSMNFTSDTQSVISTLTYNLSNLTTTGDYISGSSLIIESLLLSAGSMAFSFQAAYFEEDFTSGTATTTTTDIYGSTHNPPFVPEPATLLLFGTGLTCLAGVVRRKASH